MKAKIILCLIFIISIFRHSYAANTYYIPVFKPQPQYWSGMVITNLSSNSNANIEVTVYNQSGKIQSSESKTIASSGQETYLAGKSVTSDGWIKVTSDQLLTGLNFLGKYDDSLVNYSLSDVPFIDTLFNSLIIPHVAQNTNWDTEIFVVNPNTSAAIVTLTYTSKSGSSLTPYVISLPANGGKEISMKSISNGTSIKGGSLLISSSQGLVAFAIFSNLKTGNNGYTGIAAQSFSSLSQNFTYPVVGTNQSTSFDNSDMIDIPLAGDDFYGQNSNYPGTAPQYVNNGNGTVTDCVTGLMWQQSFDHNGDGEVNYNDKLTYNEILALLEKGVSFSGYNDWRLPTIKEMYSLILFSGRDIAPDSISEDNLTPFIDNNTFEFAYGDLDAGERLIDMQCATTTVYVSDEVEPTVFGVNFADGRIKGYGYSMPGGMDKAFNYLLVRGNTSYGVNRLVDNNDGTITDEATGLMWMQNDNGEGILWKDALAYAEGKEFAGYSNWRLPDVKELQSIVDYTRSPATTNSASIDPLFNCTQIANEAGQTDYPWYYSSTTHASMNSGGAAAYVAFGRSLGNMNGWIDIHGAGSQRSDPKTGNPDDYSEGHGPQGDAIRIYNYVRLVRSIDN